MGLRRGSYVLQTSKARVVNLGTTTNLCSRNFIPNRRRRKLGKQRCNFQFCFIFTI